MRYVIETYAHGATMYWHEDQGWVEPPPMTREVDAPEYFTLYTLQQREAKTLPADGMWKVFVDKVEYERVINAVLAGQGVRYCYIKYRGLNISHRFFYFESTLFETFIEAVRALGHLHTIRWPREDKGDRGISLDIDEISAAWAEGRLVL